MARAHATQNKKREVRGNASSPGRHDMADANDNDPLFLPLRFPFVDPTNTGPDNVPFKVPRDFGFRQPFRLYGRRFTDDLDLRNREEKFMFVDPTCYKEIHAY